MSHYIDLNDSVHKEWQQVIATKDVQKLEKFCESHDVHFEMDFPAREAAQQGNMEMVQFFVSRGANVTQSVQKISEKVQYMFHESALIRACRSGNAELIQYLLNMGADVNENFGTPIQTVCREGHMEALKVLLQKGATLHSRCLGNACARNPIHNDEEEDFMSIVKLLIEKGANIHAPFERTSSWDYRNQSPIGVAIACEQNDIARYLFSLGVDPRQDNGNPLDEALDGRNEEMFEEIFQRGNYTVEETKGAFVEAAEHGCFRIIRFLSEKGMDPISYGKALIGASWCDRTEIAKFLLEKGADIHMEEDNALMCASMTADPEMIELLLKAGANPNGKINNGCSQALRYAIEFGHFQTVRLLIEAGATYDPHTILDLVKIKEYPKIVSYLLSKGVLLKDAQEKEFSWTKNAPATKKELPSGTLCKGSQKEILPGEGYYQCRNDAIGPHFFSKEFMDSLEGEISDYWCALCCRMNEEGTKVWINSP